MSPSQLAELVFKTNCFFEVHLARNVAPVLGTESGPKGGPNSGAHSRVRSLAAGRPLLGGPKFVSFPGPPCEVRCGVCPFPLRLHSLIIVEHVSAWCTAPRRGIFLWKAWRGVPVGLWPIVIRGSHAGMTVLCFWLKHCWLCKETLADNRSACGGRLRARVCVCVCVCVCVRQRPCA